MIQQKHKKRLKNNKKIKNRNNTQKRYDLGKKRRHTSKTQIVIDKKSKKIICTAFIKDKRYKGFNQWKTKVNPNIKAVTDNSYQGIQKLHNISKLPKKNTKKTSLI
ncbi:hypothetical protein [Holospora curviuscula]|uniref:DDE Tnp4 domain-containing protein n=1 Tax=Holospora curviuscula TaxID=1082868 RepID=A0A2S5R8X0_9PROT|nr:hypothetical protein [Holospora curviuscula]PPE03575.1 hypothetical protein HCUR_01002 [Holospora curviuscula]